MLTEDFSRIFLLDQAGASAAEYRPGYVAVFSDDGTEWEIRRDSAVHKKDSVWSCEYRNSGREILYRNRQWNYAIRLKIVKLQGK